MSTKTLHITDESQSVTKTIVLLAWPVFLEQIFTTLVSYAVLLWWAPLELGLPLR